jgi:hypothetical protein
MKLSRVLAITLLGAVAMTSSAMASGTVAGTKITNTPTLSYSMGGTTKTLKAPTSAYVVDKVINFTIARSEAKEHKVVAGRTKLVEFKLTNIGNSIENFKLSKWHNIQNVKFLSKKFYVDTNGNGVLDKAEKVDAPLVKKLKMDGSRKIWMELKIDSKAIVGKRSDSGILAQAVDKASKPYVATKTNRMGVEDIVFADGKVYAPVDKARDGKMSMWYGFTIIQDTSKVKLDISPYGKLDTAMIVQHDPVNGMRRKGVSPKAIPGATVIKRWSIKNNTKTTAKNVKFSMKIDLKKEKFATNNKTTWWAGRKGYGTQILWDAKKGLMKGQGVIKGNTITYTIAEIKPGQDVMPHMVLIIK